METTVKDMSGNKLEVGDKIKKFGLLGRETESYKEGVISHIGSMHDGGDLMIWAGSGGAHHPLACLKVKE